jgi:hypothetical protein
MLIVPFKTWCAKTCKRPYYKPGWVKDKKNMNRMEFTRTRNAIISIEITSINMFKFNIPKKPRYCSSRTFIRWKYTKGHCVGKKLYVIFHIL